MDSTQWSVVLEARDGNNAERRNALEILCRSYWPPIYAYVRRRGYDLEESKDLTQEFFARFVEKEFLKNVDPQKGRFRNFLLASLTHFLANDWHWKNAKKRGGGLSVVSIDVAEAEKGVHEGASKFTSPDAIYRRRWALVLMEQAFNRLREENGSRQRRDRFKLLEGYISADITRVPYAQLETGTGISVSALKVSVHRLRRRYGELIRDEIRRTVSTDAEVDPELRDLMAALSGN